MLIHGLACLPLSNQAIGIFVFKIPVHAVTKTAFFFTNSARKRPHTFDKFIRFELPDNDFYLIKNQRIGLQSGNRYHSIMMKIAPDVALKIDPTFILLNKILGVMAVVPRTINSMQFKDHAIRK